MWLAATAVIVALLFGYRTSRGSFLGAGAGNVVILNPSGGPTRPGVVGDAVPTQWGEVQVALAVSGGRIAGVTVPVYPHGTPEDVRINAFALPVLVKETLAAQSAHIDAVSGATVTSDGYLTSLQSALDKAGL